MTVNPFHSAVIRPGARAYRFFGSPDHEQSARLDGLLRQLRRIQRGSIVGPHGTGKSTLVHSLTKRAPAFFTTFRVLRAKATARSLRQRWKQSREIRHQAAQCIARMKNQNGLLVIDGAEQFNRVDYFCLIRSGIQNQVCILATSHRNLPLTRSLHNTSMSPDQVRSLTESLIFSADDHVRAVVLKNLGDHDLSRVENLRDYWFDLYDMVQPHLDASSFRGSPTALPDPCR